MAASRLLWLYSRAACGEPLMPGTAVMSLAVRSNRRMLEWVLFMFFFMVEDGESMVDLFSSICTPWMQL